MEASKSAEQLSTGSALNCCWPIKSCLSRSRGYEGASRWSERREGLKWLIRGGSLSPTSIQYRGRERERERDGDSWHEQQDNGLKKKKKTEMQKKYRKKCGKSEREGKGEERQEWIVENYENKKESLKKENTRLKRGIKYWRKKELQTKQRKQKSAEQKQKREQRRERKRIRNHRKEKNQQLNKNWKSQKYMNRLDKNQSMNDCRKNK